jgi:hypothetical protein
VESHTTDEGFRVTVDVPTWKEKDGDIEKDWIFPLAVLAGSPSLEQQGTTITVTQLHKQVRSRLAESTLEDKLHTIIKQTYSVFLDFDVEVFINKIKVDRQPLPIGESRELKIGRDEFEHEGVKVTLLATLAARDDNGEWTQDLAGWYVLCNGRTIVNADKTELTGWGSGSAEFHSKYRGFIGIALFVSSNPLLLPWTTRKRDLNREAPVFQVARNRMKGLARPVLTFLNSFYSNDLEEEPVGRAIAEAVKPTDYRIALKKSHIGSFSVRQRNLRKDAVKVRFEAKLKEIDRVRKRLQEPAMSYSDIGRHTFDYFLNVECVDE